MTKPYDTARFRLMTAQFDWVALDLILVAFSGPPTTAFFATDVTLTAVKGHGGITERGRSFSILGKAVQPDGTAKSNPVVIPGISAGGAQVTFMIMAINNVVPDLAVPILFIDQITGMPFPPNGLDVVVQPDWSVQQGWWRA